MTLNRNGRFGLAVDSDNATNISNCVLGMTLADAQRLVLTVPITVSTVVNNPLLALVMLEKPEVNPDIFFYRVTRDLRHWLDPEQTTLNPDFGSVLTLEAGQVQPTLSFTGLYPVDVIDPEPPHNVVHHLYLNPNGDNGTLGQVFNFSVTLDFLGALPPGNYQGDWAFICNGGLRGHISFLLEVLDTAKLFQGSPGTVWYHPV